MAKLPEKLVKLLQEIDITQHKAVWDCHGTPVLLHKALEKIAQNSEIIDLKYIQEQLNSLNKFSVIDYLHISCQLKLTYGILKDNKICRQFVLLQCTDVFYDVRYLF